MATDVQMSHDQDAADPSRERLLARYERVIRGRCIARTGNRWDGEDVAHDVVLRLLSELERGRRYPVPYDVVVHKVIGWTLNDHFGGRRTDVPLPDGWEPWAPEGEQRGSDDVDSRLTLEATFADLPPRERDVCTLVYLQGLSPEQAAGELGITRNNVDQALHRGRTKLREVLRDE